MSVDGLNQESRRLLVEDCIADIRILNKNIFNDFFGDFFFGFVVFANQPSVHDGGVSRVRVRVGWN